MIARKFQIYYYDPGSILVVNPQGKIRKLYTPFKVICIETISSCLKKGTMVFVDEVKTADKDQLIFVVAGQEHPYKLFRIQINF